MFQLCLLHSGRDVNPGITVLVGHCQYTQDAVARGDSPVSLQCVQFNVLCCLSIGTHADIERVRVCRLQILQAQRPLMSNLCAFLILRREVFRGVVGNDSNQIIDCVPWLDSHFE